MAITTPGVNQSNQDLVAILDAQTFRPLFANSKITRVTVRETSKLTTFAVEDGTQRTDHRVIDPVEIDLPILLTEFTRDLYQQLRAAYLEGRELIIQTKVSSYPSMMIYECPHDETPDTGDAIAIAVKLREIMTYTPEFGSLPPLKVTNLAQSSTVQKGQQQTTESTAATQRRASVLYRISN
ncbi:structural protein [Pseudomonas phage vB_PcuM_ KLEP17-4]|nr:structural protein [Pseudomonas phage vB_PcuM_ KLEP17-4]